MSALAVSVDIKIYCTLSFLLLISYHHRAAAADDYINLKDRASMNLLFRASSEIIKSTFVVIEGVEAIRQKHINKPSFEIGYLTYTVFEKYRKMVDKYNTSLFLDARLYTMEMIMYLEEIENHHWEVQHLIAVHTNALNKLLNDTIYKDLSWSVKLLLLKDFMKDNKTATTKRTAITTPMVLVTEPDPRQPQPLGARRMPIIEALVIKRRQEDPVPKGSNDDDNSMRLKLFRLMYETIKDSDVKCKRAELIRSHYENSSSFEIGYLMGDVMDKYNIMSDISMTLNRLFHEWKPIEHINAYEQISNQAIEINHLIDMMKGISKKQASDESKKKGLRSYEIEKNFSIYSQPRF